MHPLADAVRSHPKLQAFMALQPRHLDAILEVYDQVLDQAIRTDPALAEVRAALEALQPCTVDDTSCAVMAPATPTAKGHYFRDAAAPPDSPWCGPYAQRDQAMTEVRTRHIRNPAFFELV